MRRSKLFTYLLALCFLGASDLIAQDVTASMVFLKKTVEVGKVTPVEVEIIHPVETTVIFPDSAMDFQHFEVHHTEIEPTKTEKGVSIDKKTYYLQTFEIDSVQKLSLQYQYVIGGDTVLAFMEPDSIVLEHNVSEIPTSPDSLKQAMKYVGGLEEVEVPADYTQTFIVLGIVIASILLLGGILYRPIRKRIALWMIAREWKKLLLDIEALRGSVEKPKVFIDDLNGIWKTYLDRDWKIPFRSLTSPEIEEALTPVSDINQDQKELLVNVAKSGDLIIYAGMTYPRDYLEQLLDGVVPILEDSFDRKRKAWKRKKKKK